MGGQQQRVTTSHDSALGWLILAVIGMVCFYVFWQFFQYEIKSAFRWIRWTEMWIAVKFLGDNYSVHWDNYDVNYRDLMDTVYGLPSSKLDGQALGALSYVAMFPLRLPIAAALGAMGLWCLMYGPGTQYRRKLNLDGLIKAQSGVFPTITPFVKFKPGDQPPRAPGAPVPSKLPSFSEALAPEEWVVFNRIPVLDGNINEQATTTAFARQLGPPWRGAMKLAPYKQIMLASFCLKASRKRRDCDDMIGRLACCWSFEGSFNLARDKSLHRDALKVLRDKKLAAKTLERCNQHGFETTALLRALATAREEGGVMAPAQFVWLRGYDRTLWYPLNNLGRQSYHMEALGAIAHYKAEKMTRRPIPRPKVQEAVRSIAGYMKSPRARPLPPLDEKGKGGDKKK